MGRYYHIFFGDFPLKTRKWFSAPLPLGRGAGEGFEEYFPLNVLLPIIEVTESPLHTLSLRGRCFHDERMKLLARFPSQRGGVRGGGPYALCGAMHSIRSFSESFT